MGDLLSIAWLLLTGGSMGWLHGYHRGYVTRKAEDAESVRFTKDIVALGERLRRLRPFLADDANWPAIWSDVTLKHEPYQISIICAEDAQKAAQRDLAD